MTQKKNMVKLAKKVSDTNTKTTTKAKTSASTVKKKNTIKKATTPTKKVDKKAIRDEKAKQKVEDLLRDVKLTKTDDNEIVVHDNKGNEQSLRWFQEQTALLSDEVERLRLELSNKPPKTGINTDTDILKRGVITLFNEIQENYFKLGLNEFGRPNLIIHPIPFMRKMINFFPFLTEHNKIK